MSSSKRNPLLVDILAALGDVQITQKYIIDRSRKKNYFLHGTQQEKHIVINEAPAVVSTLLHELCHYVRPQWKERTVRRFTTILLRQMSHSEIKAIYSQYQKRKADEE
jgi:hypothetical protein